MPSFHDKLGAALLIATIAVLLDLVFHFVISVALEPVYYFATKFLIILIVATIAGGDHPYSAALASSFLFGAGYYLLFLYSPTVILAGYNITFIELQPLKLPEITALGPLAVNLVWLGIHSITFLAGWGFVYGGGKK